MHRPSPASGAVPDDGLTVSAAPGGESIGTALTVTWCWRSTTGPAVSVTVTVTV